MKMEFDNIRELNAAEFDEVAGGLTVKFGASEAALDEGSVGYAITPPIVTVDLTGYLRW